MSIYLIIYQWCIMMAEMISRRQVWRLLLLSCCSSGTPVHGPARGGTVEGGEGAGGGVLGVGEVGGDRHEVVQELSISHIISCLHFFLSQFRFV